MLRRLLLIGVALALTAAPMSSNAFGNGTGFKTGSCELAALGVAPGSSGRVLTVGQGQAYGTIQDAVDAANEGDHIVIHPGIYAEHVRIIDKPGLRVTGTDRDTVIIDGGSSNSRRIGIEVKRSDRVLLENMTGRQHQLHSFYWESSTGYWGRYLTAYNQGDYGIFAYDSRCGQFDNTYSSGAQDGGIYIGECFPCDAVVTNIESTENGLGYSGTNAGGNLILKDSWWHNNGLGIVPNSLDGEVAPPQRGTTIKNNLIENNSNLQAPGRGAAADFYGVGIAIAGGNQNQIIGNTVRNHALAGIVMAPLATESSKPYLASSNIVWGNTVSGSGLADLAQGATAGPNNCWSHNTYGTSAPVALQTIWGCTNTDPESLPYYPGITPPGGDPRVEMGFVEGIAGLNGRNASRSDWKTWPTPTCGTPGPNQRYAPNSCINLPDETGDGTYANDGAPDIWLWALL